MWLSENKIKVFKDFNIKYKSWLKAGGVVKNFITPNNEVDCIKLIKFFYENKFEFYVLGNISNTLIRDGEIHTPIINLYKLSGIFEKQTHGFCANMTFNPKNSNTKFREFLKITCPISQTDKCLKKFFKKYNIRKSVINYALPIKSLSKIGYKIIFSTNFGRDLEYYTGMVFEILALKNKQEIARGGRYDDLLKSLGSKKNISAVGAAINLNNLSRILK